MRKLAVVGCGPAGLAFAAASQLNESAGDELILFERQAALSPTGSGFILQPTGLAIAETLGIREHLEKLGHKIRFIEGRTRRGDRLIINVDYGLLTRTPYALGLHRTSLYWSLLRLVRQARIRTVANCTVARYANLPSGKIELFDIHNTSLGVFDLVVDASGVKSQLRQQAPWLKASKVLKYGSMWTTLEARGDFPKQNVLQQKFGGAGQSIGVMPIGKEIPTGPEKVAFFCDVEIAKKQDVVNMGLEAWKARVREVWPASEVLLGQIESFSQLKFAVYRHHMSRRMHGPGIVFIGDAAHATSPLLGQGVNMSLIDAMVLARSLQNHPNVFEACEVFSRLRSRHVRVVQFLAGCLIPFYKSNFTSLATLRNILYRPLASLPEVDRFTALMVAGLLPNPLREL